MSDKRTRGSARESARGGGGREKERGQDDRSRARFSYANNNHNNGFAYHRALAPLGLIPQHCGRQPHSVRVRRGIESRRAEGELNAVQTRRYPFSRSIGTDRREAKRSRAQRHDTTTVPPSWFFNTIMGETAPLTHGCFALNISISPFKSRMYFDTFFISDIRKYT